MLNLCFILHFLSKGIWPLQYTTQYHCLFIQTDLQVFLDAQLFFPLMIWNSYLSFSLSIRSSLPLLPLSQTEILGKWFCRHCMWPLCFRDEAWGCVSTEAWSSETGCEASLKPIFLCSCEVFSLSSGACGCHGSEMWPFVWIPFS